jgi:DNA-binding beta-propeller fold protein YncE
VGTLTAFILGIRLTLRNARVSNEDIAEGLDELDTSLQEGAFQDDMLEMIDPVADEEEDEFVSPEVDSGSSVAIPLFGFWILTSLAAYTMAGEKMPWLTFHIALPMILVSAWAFGRLVDSIDWAAFRKKRGMVIIGLLLVFIPSSAAAIYNLLLSPTPPFQGSELESLQATSNFMLGLIAMIASGWGLFALARSWHWGQVFRLTGLSFVGLLTLLTARTAITATFINYDKATEYLVYAHAAGPVKEVLAQAEEISRRVAGDLSMAVAYDDDVSWPFTWYMRNFPNHRYYGQNPTRDLRDVPFIVVGDSNYSKIVPVVGQAYYQFDYIRMWWPNQDYFNLDRERVRSTLTNREMLGAIFNIWFNRDYDLYGQLTGADLSIANWYPSDRFRLYIRKDIAAEIWEYGLGPSSEELVVDPYEGKDVVLPAEFFFGTEGSEAGVFNAPRGIATSPDGSIYIADSGNHRIQHFAQDGSLLNAWGSFADATVSAAPGGTFNAPWDVAVGPDGSIYVADTWNHRVQKFSPQGEFLTMWGYFGAGEAPEAFWGPRSIAVGADGNVFVTDTGNKRVVVFTADGAPVTSFGSLGFAPGQFDEPVGLALDDQGRLFVADTWNQRIQVLTTEGSPVFNWEVFAWFGNSLENKPYIAVDAANNRLYIADPEGYRILEYTLEGEFIRYWGDFSNGPDGFGLVSGLAVDGNGGLWVTDGANNRVLYFSVGP